MERNADTLNESQQALVDFRRSLYRPAPKESVTEWAQANILINRGTETPGPYSISTRPYCREVLECFRDSAVTDLVLCWGSQTSKTTTIMVGLCWMIDNEPSPALWLMPNETLARSFSNSRWRPMLDDSETMRKHFPSDIRKLAAMEMQFQGCTLNFVGSNSPSNLASRPVRVLIADEVDKFATASSREAAALELAMQRTKSFSGAKHVLTSTPTVTTGDIWQNYLRGDQRRFFVPCPHCQTMIVLDWKQVKWDDPETGVEAKNWVGEWDFPKVRAYARYECQSCGKPISDSQKVTAIRKGEWRPTNATAMPGVRSYHLSSLYAPDRRCTWGSLAVDFLQKKSALLGLQGFINGTLAEPWEEDFGAQRTGDFATEEYDPFKPTPDEKARCLTADRQSEDTYWVMIRAWTKTGGQTRRLYYGRVFSEVEIEALREKYNVPTDCTLIDSGYRPKGDQGVYAACIRYGWIALKGTEEPHFLHSVQARPGSPFYKIQKPWAPLTYGDPGEGTSMQGKKQCKLVRFSSPSMAERVVAMVSRKLWIEPAAPEDKGMDIECRRQMQDERREVKRNRVNGRVEVVWKTKTGNNHAFDCAKMQMLFAMITGLLPAGLELAPAKAAEEKQENLPI